MALKHLTSEENARYDFLAERMTQYRKQIELDDLEYKQLTALRDYRAKKAEYERS
jgi:hypothetical protein